MTLDVHAAIVERPGGPFVWSPVQLGTPRPDEIVVEIAGVGICHTDLIFRDQFMPYPLPAVFGHEGAGTVVACGREVVDLVAGDSVVLAFSSCASCDRCRQALPSYCTSFAPLNYAGARADGTTAITRDGAPLASHFFGQSSFATHAVVPARNAVKVDSAGLRLELLGPLGCGYQTGAGVVMRSLDCPSGASIVIVGAGPVGLAAVMAARVRRCDPVIVVEPLPARREAALALGATHAIAPSGDALSADLRAIVPGGVDFALDTTGRIDVINAAVAALGNRGALGLVGVPAVREARIDLSIAALIGRGIRIIGILEGDSDPHRFIPELVALHRSGAFPFERITRTFPFAAINDAVAAQACGDCVKAVLVPDR